MSIKVNGVYYTCKKGDLDKILNGQGVVYTSSHEHEYHPGALKWLADPDDD